MQTVNTNKSVSRKSNNPNQNKNTKKKSKDVKDKLNDSKGRLSEAKDHMSGAKDRLSQSKKSKNKSKSTFDIQVNGSKLKCDKYQQSVCKNKSQQFKHQKKESKTKKSKTIKQVTQANQRKHKQSNTCIKLFNKQTIQNTKHTNEHPKTYNQNKSNQIKPHQGKICKKKHQNSQKQSNKQKLKTNRSSTMKQDQIQNQKLLKIYNFYKNTFDINLKNCIKKSSASQFPPKRSVDCDNMNSQAYSAISHRMNQNSSNQADLIINKLRSGRYSVQQNFMHHEQKDINLNNKKIKEQSANIKRKVVKSSNSQQKQNKNYLNQKPLIKSRRNSCSHLQKHTDKQIHLKLGDRHVKNTEIPTKQVDKHTKHVDKHLVIYQKKNDYVKNVKSELKSKRNSFSHLGIQTVNLKNNNQKIGEGSQNKASQYYYQLIKMYKRVIKTLNIEQKQMQKQCKQNKEKNAQEQNQSILMEYKEPIAEDYKEKDLNESKKLQKQQVLYKQQENKPIICNQQIAKNSFKFKQDPFQKFEEAGNEVASLSSQQQQISSKYKMSQFHKIQQQKIQESEPQKSIALSPIKKSQNMSMNELDESAISFKFNNSLQSKFDLKQKISCLLIFNYSCDFTYNLKAVAVEIMVFCLFQQLILHPIYFHQYFQQRVLLVIN